MQPVFETETTGQKLHLGARRGTGDLLSIINPKSEYQNIKFQTVLNFGYYDFAEKVICRFFRIISIFLLAN
jgi:hypothetical protein